MPVLDGSIASVTRAYVPGFSFSSEFGRSISTRIVRVEGSSASAVRVTAPSIVAAAASYSFTSALVPGRIAEALDSGTNANTRTTSIFWQVNSGVVRVEVAA